MGVGVNALKSKIMQMNFVHKSGVTGSENMRNAKEWLTGWKICLNNYSKNNF